MKKALNLKVILVVLSMVLAMSTILSACGSSSSDNSASGSSQTSDATASSNSTSTSNVSGSITAAGSTALQPLVQQAADQFMAANPNAKIQVQGGGSGAGLSQVVQGTINIGDSDIFSNEKITDGSDKDLIDHKVCVVGFAAIVNPKVKVDSLTKQQLIDIFTGKITNWKDVGGDNLPITIINRAAGSGTRASFKKYALGGNEEITGKALTQDSNGAVLKTVSETEGSISYLAIPYIDSTVKVLKLDGVGPTNDNIMSGKYPVWSYEHMYTKGEATGLAKAFLDYIAGNDGVQLIDSLKYIPTSKMQVTR